MRAAVRPGRVGLNVGKSAAEPHARRVGARESALRKRAEAGEQTTRQVVSVQQSMSPWARVLASGGAVTRAERKWQEPRAGRYPACLGFGRGRLNQKLHTAKLPSIAIARPEQVITSR